MVWLIRHGESTANIARHKSESENLLTIDFPEREPDVPLSAGGEQQSMGLGKWLAQNSEKPSFVYSSPYLRTRETARIVLETANIKNAKIFYDERLRERELGIFDRLTRSGGIEKYPEESAKRELLGKFYYRPIGGESWCDVALRVRSVWRDIRATAAGANVLIVTHEAVIHLFRYVLENLTEAEILAIDRSCDIGNCAVTAYNFDETKNAMILHTDNFTA